MNWPIILAGCVLAFVGMVIFVMTWSCFCDRPEVTLAPWEDDE